MSTFDYCALVDGGAKNNGAVDALGFGSYRLRARDGKETIVRVELGRGVTNNEAEYRILIAALEDLAGRIRKAGKNPRHFSVMVSTDSLLVVNQVAGRWQVKAAGLAPLCQKAREMLGLFGNATVRKAARADVVAVLGH